MNDEEKLLWMFEQVHGVLSGSCYAQVNEDEEGHPMSVSCMKNGCECWTATKADLVFDYLTKDL